MAETYVVTGAGRGLGLEFARQLTRRGDNVIATARSHEGITELARNAQAANTELLDLGSQESISSFSHAIGDVSVDVLVNNAAIGVGGKGFEEEDWDEVSAFFAVNSVGPMRLTRALLPNLRNGRRRLIVNISSVMGSLQMTTSGGAYGYRASKVALNMLSRTMAFDLSAEGFTCVMIHPGWVATRMGGHHAPVRPEESVSRMLAVMDGISRSDTGRFIDLHGQAINW